MLQENSNGDTFEIIEGMSVTDLIASIPSTASSVPSSAPSDLVTGNLLSNVQPPSALPNFITQVPITTPLPAPQPAAEVFVPTQFSAAIPPSKGIKHGVQIPEALPIEPAQENTGFIDWMKGAVSSGGILSKVAEKAKSSVDSMITTLDPQMKEFIYTGGDVEILVASKQEMKVSAIREAFQSVFGKARVEGIEAKAVNIAAQPVGFAAGVKAAEERIQAVLTNPKLPNPIPVVAIENFLLEVGEDKWYDLGVIILNDPIKEINLQTFTQMTPVPTEIVNLAQEDTKSDYPLAWSGLAVTVGSLMGSNLHVSHSEWHQALTGVSRREIILSAAKVLANLYKNSTT
ncbi:PREDICTED: protein PRRC1-like [Nicrophorus vespilloides]|uniref:Protein PRRC1-like n=1 Tax=Nicrophorus vespilloides TaxID=110193 RepID=A0ABM1MP38_NICVS|nr:PREDICTED: protein PRRC1-like [Nicrophorus vespilloides]